MFVVLAVVVVQLTFEMFQINVVVVVVVMILWSLSASKMLVKYNFENWTQSYGEILAYILLYANL